MPARVLATLPLESPLSGNTPGLFVVQVGQISRYLDVLNNENSKHRTFGGVGPAGS